jgi:hypothetical protein
MLKGLFFISGLRGLMGRAKRSSSASPVAGLGIPISPLAMASKDMGAPVLWPTDLEIDEKDETATSLPMGDRV